MPPIQQMGARTAGSSSRVLHLCPAAAAANAGVGGPGCRFLRWRRGPLPTGLRSAYSPAARAAVEEGGLVGEEAGCAAGSFYELLGISEGGSFEEIKKAYKRLARKYHPDVSPPHRAEECTQRFIEVQEAYETLSDPGLRVLYDRHLSRGLHLAFSSRGRFDEDCLIKTGMLPPLL